jgi:hypothetical protein
MTPQMHPGYPQGHPQAPQNASSNAGTPPQAAQSMQQHQQPPTQRTNAGTPPTNRPPSAHTPISNGKFELNLQSLKINLEF